MSEEIPQHMWCNHAHHLVPDKGKNCKMCKKFFEKYPENDMSMYAKYFPEAEVLNGTSIQDDNGV